MKSSKIELATFTCPSSAPFPVSRSLLLAAPLFSLSRPRRPLVLSAPVRALYKERTDHGPQPALLSHAPAPCSGGSLKSKRIIQILSAVNCRFLGPNTR